MKPIVFIDRLSRVKMVEKVYGDKVLSFLYGESFFSKIVGVPLMHLLSRVSFFSACVGFWQNRHFTKKRIKPFIESYAVDEREFEKPVDQFESFNDFFIRKLKQESRPIDSREDRAVIPADGRYSIYPNMALAKFFQVKGNRFTLEALLGDEKLAKSYQYGSMVLARLCPSDYHRFHFPVDCIPASTEWINGWLYSVNPIAIKKNFGILSENKRSLCVLDSQRFGKVLYLEIGATSVGSIHETYTPSQPYKKGAEKGFFSFGGSTLILLFEPNKIAFDKDLIEASEEGLEMKCLMGQSMGVAIESL
ncbi:Phosphatidylserine decarboxylase proenzyme [Chlamydiales bacterium STE3]|nr:Phosphatidylserine decarboxylase proenzyme [Chlamydiales bacterium STE3]